MFYNSDWRNTILSVLFVYRTARLKNVDRNTAHHMVVSVGDVTVIITDYKLKPLTDASTSSMDSTIVDDISLYGHSSDTDLSD